MTDRRGFTLISILIASAVTGILAVIIMSIVDNTTRVMVRSNVQESIEGLLKVTAGVLANNQLCSSAIRGNTPADKVPFDPDAGVNAFAEIRNIFMTPIGPAAPAPTSVLSVNMQVFAGIQIDTIRFRENQVGVGRGSVRTPDGMRQSIAGHIEINLRAINPALLGGAVTRRVPLTVLRDTGTGLIEGCLVQSDEVQNLCATMGGNYDPNSKTCTGMNPIGNMDCQTRCQLGPNPTCPAGLTTCFPPVGHSFPVANCPRIFYMTGITVVGTQTQPKCACRATCYRGAVVNPVSPQNNSAAATAAPAGAYTSYN